MEDKGQAQVSALIVVLNMALNYEIAREMFLFEGLVAALLKVIIEDRG
jgi:hypothetical protein